MIPLTEILIVRVTKALDGKGGSLSLGATIVIPAQGKCRGKMGFVGKVPGRNVFMGKTHQRKGRKDV